MNELKPCPFCGGNNCGVRAGTDEIWCVCGGHSPHGWNSRPIEDALRAENEKLKSLIRYTIEWCNDFNFDYMVRGLQDKLQKALSEEIK